MLIDHNFVDIYEFVKLMLKIWPELMVLLSSISYTIIRLVADVNKLPLPTWFDDFNIPNNFIILMVFNFII